MALTLDIAANTRQAQGQVKDLSKELDKTADALDDLAREGDKAGTKLERSFRDMVRDSEKASDAIKRDSKESFADASGNVQSFKQEAVQNFSEVASSFDGDIRSMADGVQGLTGGLAASLTPGIGIPVAILGAAAGAFLQSWITAAEDSEERVQEMYQAMAEEGSRFLSEDFLNKAIAELDTSQIEEAQRKASELGVSERDTVRAMVGDREAIGRILASQSQARHAELQAIRDSGKSLEEQAVAVDGVNAKYGTQSDWLRDIQRDTGTATELWETFNTAMYKTPAAISDAERTVAEFKRVTAQGVTLPMRVDTGPITAAQRALDDLQRRANRGIDVIVRHGQAVWE